MYKNNWVTVHRIVFHEVFSHAFRENPEYCRERLKKLEAENRTVAVKMAKEEGLL